MFEFTSTVTRTPTVPQPNNVIPMPQFNRTADASPAQRDPQVKIQLEILHRVKSNLEDLTNRIIERLSPVCTDPVCTDPGCPVGAGTEVPLSTVCPIAHIIRDATGSMSNQMAKLENMLTRLEV